mgnify:CR=1 FL=1
MTIIELKARIYDLLVQRELLEAEMKKTNQQIAEEINRQNEDNKKPANSNPT